MVNRRSDPSECTWQGVRASVSGSRPAQAADDGEQRSPDPVPIFTDPVPILKTKGQSFYGLPRAEGLKPAGSRAPQVVHLLTWNQERLLPAGWPSASSRS